MAGVIPPDLIKPSSKFHPTTEEKELLASMEALPRTSISCTGQQQEAHLYSRSSQLSLQAELTAGGTTELKMPG